MIPIANNRTARLKDALLTVAAELYGAATDAIRATVSGASRAAAYCPGPALLLDRNLVVHFILLIAYMVAMWNGQNDQTSPPIVPSTRPCAEETHYHSIHVPETPVCNCSVPMAQRVLQVRGPWILDIAAGKSIVLVGQFHTNVHFQRKLVDGAFTGDVILSNLSDISVAYRSTNGYDVAHPIPMIYDAPAHVSNVTALLALEYFTENNMAARCLGCDTATIYRYCTFTDNPAVYAAMSSAAPTEIIARFFGPERQYETVCNGRVLPYAPMSRVVIAGNALVLVVAYLV